MSTWRSEKARLAGQSLGILGAVTATVWAMLSVQAARAERLADAHPYLGFEEPRRLLLPTVAARPEHPRLAITGSSEAVSGLDHRLILASLPGYHGVQLGMSGVLLDDLLLAGRFLLANYGSAGRPDVLVVGLTAGVVVPPTVEYDYAPLVETVDDFSRFEVVVDRTAPDGSRLTEKPVIDAMMARWHFLVTGQQARHRAGMAAVVGSLIGTTDPRASAPTWRAMTYTEPITSRTNLPVFWRHVRTVGPARAFGEWAHRYVTPYDLQLHGTIPRVARKQQLGSRTEFAWDGEAHRDVIHGQLSALAEFASANDIELFVVNLPEPSYSRARYRHADAYHDLLASVFDDRLLDLFDAVPDDLFFDTTHLTLEGAALASEATGAFLARRLAPSGKPTP